MNLIIGSHVSFTKDKQLLGSLEEALSYGANTFMFYTGAPQNTNRCEIDEEIIKRADELMKENNINKENIIVHAPYIINLANDTKPESYDFSINFLKQELSRCEKLDVKYLVLHPGSHVGLGEEKALNNIVNALKKILDKKYYTNILIETMAGKGSEVGININQIKYIIDNVNSENLMVCLDTCHLNDSGVDISKFDEYLDKFDKEIGISKIGCVHVNDSCNQIGAGKDRHANIGFGTIGFENLINVIYNSRLENVSKILETPYITENDDSKKRLYPPYKEEIQMIKSKEFDSKMIEKIRNKNKK